MWRGPFCSPECLSQFPSTSCFALPLIFGDDLTYEIRALLCDQVGPNLRNNIAHGLLNDREAQSVDAVCAWWLGLKLVFNTFWNSLGRETVGEQQEQASEDDSV